MRLFKVLAVFVMLLALTVCAASAQTLSPYTKEELKAMTITLPVGLAVTNTEYSEGLVQIYVNSADTKWDYIAAQSDSWNGAPLRISMDVPEGAEGQRGLMGRSNVGSASASEDLQKALTEMWTFATIDMGDMSDSPTNSSVAGYEDSITEYSAETNTVTPIAYSGNRSLLFVHAFYSEYENEDSFIGDYPKYAMIELIYTDNSSVKVEDIGVPSGRITLDAAAQDTESYTSSGVAVYQFEANNQPLIVTTKVTAPDGAEKAVSAGTTYEVNDDGEIIVVMAGIPKDNYYEYNILNLLWYNADGGVIDAERLVVSVQVGDPVVWPNYVTDHPEFTMADVNAYFTRNGSEVNTAYLNVDYNEDNGTVTVSANNSIATANEDMTTYTVMLEITAPNDAAYGTSYGTLSANALGSQNIADRYNDRNDLMEVVQNSKPGDSGYVEIIDHKAYFEETLFKSTSYASDPGLTVYYDANMTDKAAAILEVIDWWDDFGNFMGRQWYAVQFKPLAATVTENVQTQAPADTDTPVLVAETAVQEDYTLRVQSYAQESESGTQVHYELELLDANGENVSLSELNTDVQLLLPYQTDDGMKDENTVYTVRHYNSNGVLQESFTEGGANVTLERVDSGILMTISSLSPFVLSWDHVHNLVYTVSGNTFVETCSDTSCTHRATWSLEVNETVEVGSTIEINPDRSANWLGSGLAIVLTDADGNVYDEVPTVPGAYTLKVSVGNAEMTFPITVIAPPSLPATGDNSLPLALLAAMAFASITAIIVMKKARRA